MFPFPQAVHCLITGFCAGIILSLGMTLIACSEADTLAGEEPDEVVITGTPTWENGVKKLVGLKCATCHTVPPNDLTPDNAPQNLNLNEYSGNENYLGATTLGFWISAGILETKLGTVRQMPLDYATPLTQKEKDALKTWADLGVPEK